MINQDFVIFGEDFGRHSHSLEHLLRPLFERNRFIWVETIGLRSPKISFYDFKRILGKIRGWLKPAKFVQAQNRPGNIVIVSPIMIPFSNISLVRAFNKWSVSRTVNKVICRQKFADIISISSVPNACDYVGSFEEVLKVYVCVDEFSLWPGLDYSLVSRMEKKLLSAADMVFATSHRLVNTKSKEGRPAILLTHGVDFQHFNIGIKSGISGPLRICYFGLFDERSDQNILIHIAQSFPNCIISIIGNVVCDVKNLRTFENIRFQGPVDYCSLPEAIKDMDIFILPYVRNELTNNINPLKLKEYLSTGRPVIATPLPEVLKLQEHLFLGNTGTDFVRVIQDILNSRMFFKNLETPRYLYENETWKAKSELFCKELGKALQAKDSFPI